MVLIHTARYDDTLLDACTCVIVFCSVLHPPSVKNVEPILISFITIIRPISNSSRSLFHLHLLHFLHFCKLYTYRVVFTENYNYLVFHHMFYSFTQSCMLVLLAFIHLACTSENRKLTRNLNPTKDG